MGLDQVPGHFFLLGLLPSVNVLERIALLYAEAPKSLCVLPVQLLATRRSRPIVSCPAAIISRDYEELLQ